MTTNRREQVRELLAANTRLAQENARLKARLEARIVQIMLLCEQAAEMVILARAQGLEFNFEDKGDTASVGCDPAANGEQLH